MCHKTLQFQDIRSKTIPLSSANLFTTNDRLRIHTLTVIDFG